MFYAVSGLADMRTYDCHTCLKSLLTELPRSLLFLYSNSLMWYLKFVKYKPRQQYYLLMTSIDLQKARNGTKKRQAARTGCGGTRAC